MPTYGFIFYFVFVKSAEQMLKGGAKPDQPQHYAIEEQTRTSDVESDHGDDD